MNNFKPMLASLVNLSVLEYPVLCTPKLDGIRCVIVDGKPYTRAMKPIPNEYIYNRLSSLFNSSLDGELMAEGDFNSVQSAVMNRKGTPNFVYYVFDTFSNETEGLGYSDRVVCLSTKCFPKYVKLLKPVQITSQKYLLEYLDNCIAAGYEGIMIRTPDGPYKFGRSTVKEGYLLKLKRFHDDEGELVEVIEKLHNANELEQDELGYAKRSSKKENLVQTGTAGSCTIRWNNLEFNVGFGPGIIDEDKQYIWDNRETLKGSLVKFSYQDLSKDGVPRFGKFLCFRHKDDL